MRIHKMSSQFIVPHEDVQTGDLVTIVDEGELVEGEYGTRVIFGVILPNGEQKQKRMEDPAGASWPTPRRSF